VYFLGDNKRKAYERLSIIAIKQELDVLEGSTHFSLVVEE